MNPFAHRADPHEQGRQPRARLDGLVWWVELQLVEAVCVAHQLLLAKPLVTEGLRDEVGGAEQGICKKVLFFLFPQPYRVVGVLVIGGKVHAKAFAFARYGFVGKPRVRVGTFERGRDAEPVGCPQRVDRSERQVCTRSMLRLAWGGRERRAGLEVQCSNRPNPLVWDAPSSACKRCMDADARWQRPVDRSGHDRKVAAGVCYASSLMPGDPADPIRPDLVWKLCRTRSGISNHQRRFAGDSCD